MRPSAQVWLLALAGPTIGFLHLLALYGWASLGEAPLPAGGPSVRLGMAATTTVAALVNAWVVSLAWRGRLPVLAREPDAEAVRFWRGVIGLGAGISLLTVLYQGLPALVVPG